MNGNGSVAKAKIRVAKKDNTIGTWNGRTLNALGKVEQLDHEMRRYRWSVLGLAEVRWTGIGETTTNDGHTLWYSGEDKRHERGVGFLVHRDIVRSVLERRPISSRIIILRLPGQPFNISIIQAYAPTSTASDQEMDMFYQQLHGIMTTIPKKDVLLVIGDWNAKVGPDAYPTWQGTAGRFGLGVTNDRGHNLLEFAKFYDLVLT
ncbi:craniofacial development protein 2-like [Amphiura filiformis]|uniref:craniofacial development protein 2-like n=1 Tax=Amphiura filiformis TaxID=82378 RepID=UPI003B21AB00